MERQKLRAARLDRHWTLAQAAEKVEVDINTLSRWERGKTRPHGYNIVRLCEVYARTPAELGLESKQEMTDAVEQLLVLSSSGSSLHASMPESAVEQREQADHPDALPIVVPSPSLDSLPFVDSTPPPKYSSGRSWRRRRTILLVVLAFFLVASGGVWYTAAHSLANGPGQSLSPTMGQVTPATTARRIASGTPAGKSPASPGSTPQRPPVSSNGTPSAPASTPTGSPQHTPTPQADCLHGSASNLKFTSLLGLGNTSPDTVTVTNCGGPAENWSASVVTSSGGDWLSANPAVGTIAANGSENVQIQAAGAGLQIGTYQGSVTFLKGSARWTINVTFTIIQI